jgi:hypothetical protein
MSKPASRKRSGNAKAVDGVSVLKKPAITPDQLFAAGLLPMSRNLIYAACNTGEIECFRVGKKIIIPTAGLRRKLGIEAA